MSALNMSRPSITQNDVSRLVTSAIALSAMGRPSIQCHRLTCRRPWLSTPFTIRCIGSESERRLTSSAGGETHDDRCYDDSPIVMSEDESNVGPSHDQYVPNNHRLSPEEVYRVAYGNRDKEVSYGGVAEDGAIAAGSIPSSLAA